MSFTAGNTVQSSDFVSLKDLQDLTKSGFYQIQIVNAMYYHGIAKTSGNEYHQCRLSCKATNMNTKEEGKLSFSMFLPSLEMNHFCYFNNLKVGDQYGLPDPTHKTGVSKATGTPFEFDHFPTIEGLTCYVLLECEGLSTRQDGTNYGQFKIVAFCDAQYRSALDCENQQMQPSQYIVDFMEKIKITQTPVAQQITQQVVGNNSRQQQQGQFMQQPQAQAMTQNPQAQAMYGQNTSVQNVYNQGFNPDVAPF